jgi:hypothetical protein
MDLTSYPLEEIAAKVGTPFFLYDTGILRERMAEIAGTTGAPGLQARYALKANPAKADRRGERKRSAAGEAGRIPDGQRAAGGDADL